MDAPAAGTYTLRAKAPSGSATVASNSSAGFTRLTWEKVAGFLPVINSPVIADNSASGYMDVGGMRMQWGVYAGGQTGAAIATIIFPAAFANSNYALTATVQSYFTNRIFVVQTTAKTPIQFNFSKVYVYTDTDNKAYITGAAGEAFDWIAIGVKP